MTVFHQMKIHPCPLQLPLTHQMLHGVPRGNIAKQALNWDLKTWAGKSCFISKWKKFKLYKWALLSTESVGLGKVVIALMHFYQEPIFLKVFLKYLTRILHQILYFFNPWVFQTEILMFGKHFFLHEKCYIVNLLLTNYANKPSYILNANWN